ncbi:recombinase family protein [Bacillus sp. FSL K6-1005]|uniref:recombinase family protein n=1 Tax=Bacillus sp. FSL K6-1005 TaxID=2954676 RepID=UPI0030FA896E
MINEQIDWIIIPDTHEAIISRDLFVQVQGLLKQKAKRGRGGLEIKSPFHQYCILFRVWKWNMVSIEPKRIYMWNLRKAWK